MATESNVVPLSAKQRAELKRLAEAATPGPWAYRNEEFDDWGYVRGPADETGRHPLVAIAREGMFGLRKSHEQHRLDKTDPYGPNAQFIAAVSPALILVSLTMFEALESEAATLRGQLAAAEAERDGAQKSILFHVDKRVDAELLANQYYTDLALATAENRALTARLQEAQAAGAAMEAKAADSDRMAQEARDVLTHRCQMAHDSATWAMEEQLAEAQAAVAAAESKFSELRGQVTDLLADFANGCVPVKMERGKETTPYWLGVNKERENGRVWAELKCKELGLAWPIPTIPYNGPTPPAPTPACPGDCTTCPSIPLGGEPDRSFLHIGKIEKGQPPIMPPFEDDLDLDFLPEGIGAAPSRGEGDSQSQEGGQDA